MKADLGLSLVCAATATALLLSEPGAAQPLPSPGDGQNAADAAPAGDIVVTARRTNEALQDVPLSVTVFTATELENKGIDSAMDLAAFTPNFHFYSANGRQDTSSLYMRGLNANTTDPRYQNVTFFVDGVPLSGTVMGLSTTNVSQIEIVKGPQSATFGKATYSGAVNYITANPKPASIEGSVRGRYMNGNTVAASTLGAASIQFPIVRDALWLQVTGSYEREGAIGRDAATGAPLGRTQTTNAGALLYSEPVEGLTIKLRGQYEFDNDSAAALIQQGPRQWAAAGTLTTLPSGLLWSRKLTNPRPVGGCGAAGRAEIGHCGSERKRAFGALIVNLELGGGWEAGYLGGIGYQRGKSLYDLFYASTIDPLYSDVPTPTKAASNFVDSGFKTRDLSQQLQLSSPTEGRLRGRVGIGYFYDSITNYQTIGASTLVSAANPKGQRQGKLYGRNGAIFVGGDWDIADPLTLSLEARLERQQIGYKACTTCFYVKAFDQSTSSTNFLPRATLKYDIGERNSVYALYSKGNRPARYNDTQSPAYPLAEAEKLNNYEVGSKNYFFGRRLTLNAAGFYQKLSNQQFRTVIPNTSQQSIQNIAASRVYGFEVETVARLTRALSVQAGVGYANHKFTSNVSLEGTGTATTNLFAPGMSNVLNLTTYNTPRWNGSASIDYRTAAFAAFDFAASLDYSYTGKQFADIANVQVIDPANILNARLALESKAFTVAVLIKNLTNNNTPLGANLGTTRACLFIAPEYPAARQACNVAGMRRPREIGLEASLKF